MNTKEELIMSEFDYGEKKSNGQHEHHPSDLSGVAVRPYRDTYTHNVCGQSTRMPDHCAETYQNNPKFYGTTFCCECKEYLPVAEFKWKDGSTVGS
jgi:hypothetical protein